MEESALVTIVGVREAGEPASQDPNLDLGSYLLEFRVRGRSWADDVSSGVVVG